MSTFLAARLAALALASVSAGPQDSDSVDRGLQLRCFDAEERPIEATRVFVLDDFQYWDVSEGCNRGMAEWARRLGSELRHGEDGRWRGVPSALRVLLVAESEKLRGRAILRPGQRLAEVVLRPQQSASVQVLDGGGAAVGEGVPVALVRSDEDLDSVSRGWSPIGVDLEAVTDAEGVAHFHGIELLEPLLEEEQWVATFAFPLAEPQRAPLSMRPGAPRPTLHLPPTGSVEVAVEGLEELGFSKREPGPLWATLDGGGGRARAFVHDFGATFPYVGLLVPLTLRLEGVSIDVERSLPPLSEVGQRSSCSMELELVRLRAVLLRADGQPYRRTPVAVRLDTWAPHDCDVGGTAWLETDEEGGLDARGLCFARGPYGPKSVDGGDLRRVVRLAVEPRDSFAVLHSLLELEQSAGLIDLGAVREGSGVTLLRGEVRGPDGLPVAGARVRVVASEHSFLVSRWGDARSAADGSFRILGPEWAGAGVELEAQGPGYSTRRAVAVASTGPGTPDPVKLRVEPAASLSIPLPYLEIPGEGRTGAWVELIDVAGESVPLLGEYSGMQWERAPERVAFHGLRPGRYSLVIGWSVVELARFDEVVLVAGRESRDPRVESWDPERDTRRARVRILDREGRPAVDPTVHLSAQGSLLAPGDPDRDKLFALEAWQSPATEFALVLPPEGSVELRVSAEGYRETALRVEGDAEVRLLPRIPVQVLVPSAPKLPDHAELVLSLVPVGSAPARRGIRRRTEIAEAGPFRGLGDSGEVLLMAGEPGAYELRLYVGSGSWCTALPDATAIPIEVLDVEGRQELLVSLPAQLQEAVQGALRTLERVTDRRRRR